MAYLKPLDVVIFKGGWINPLEAGIKIRSLSEYTHTVFVKDDLGNVWNPTMGGVLDDNLNSEHLRDRPAKLLRLKEFISFDKMVQILDWCRATQAKSKGYDYTALLGFLTSVKALENEDCWYCSEFPFYAFIDNGIPICNNALTFVYPSYFADCPMFETVWEGKFKDFFTKGKP